MTIEQIKEMQEIIVENTEEVESFDVWYRELVNYLYNVEGFVDQTIKYATGDTRTKLKIALDKIKSIIGHVECELEDEEEPYNHLDDPMYIEKQRRLDD